MGKLRLTQNVLNQAQDDQFFQPDAKSLSQILKYGLEDIFHQKATVLDQDIETILKSARVLDKPDPASAEKEGKAPSSPAKAKGKGKGKAADAPSPAPSPKNGDAEPRLQQSKSLVEYQVRLTRSSFVCCLLLVVELPGHSHEALDQTKSLFIHQDAAPNSMYEFEGVDYKEPSAADAAMFDRLLAEESEAPGQLGRRRSRSSTVGELGVGELEETRRRSGEAAAARRKSKEAQLASRWAQAGYVSVAVALPTDAAGLGTKLVAAAVASAVAEEEEEEKEKEGGLNYVTGDATKPNDRPAIILCCCDNSGAWSDAGYINLLPS